MPHRHGPRLSSLVGTLSVALALAGAVALAPSTSAPAHAQGGPEYGPMFGPRGGGPGPGPFGGLRGPAPLGYQSYESLFGELAVPGQTQICRESPGATANHWAFYGPTMGEFFFPFVGYVFPPYGGVWGFYSGVGNVCLWRPT